MTDIVLVRHARSVPPAWGVPDLPDRPLTAQGLTDARALAPELLASRPDVVLSSPYLRAVQTVQPVADALGLPVLTRFELREWDSGLMPSADFAAHYERSWSDPASTHGGGESLDQVTERAVAVVRLLARKFAGQRLVIGSHGTFVSRALAGFGHPVDWAFARDMPMPAVHRLSVVAVDDEVVERVDPTPVADRVDGGAHGS